MIPLIICILLLKFYPVIPNNISYCLFKNIQKTKAALIRKKMTEFIQVEIVNLQSRKYNYQLLFVLKNACS